MKEELVGITLEKLLDICSRYAFLGALGQRVSEIKKKFDEFELLVVIVGEFNSGKSSLCNTLLGGNVLKTDVLPTTSIISEIRFSSKTDRVEIVRNNNETELYQGFSILNELNLSGECLIKIYSSSNKIPKGLVIVDTPGLSSTITAHEKTLLDYAPRADTLILAVDLNQGFTKTTIDFLNVINPLKKRIYIVLTKSDTRTSREINEMIEYAEKKLPLKPHRVIVTSIHNENKEEFYKLLLLIHSESMEIATENLKKELSGIINEITELVQSQLLSAELDTNELDHNIKKAREEISRIREQMQREIDKAEDLFEEAEDNAVRTFEKYLQQDLPMLVNVAFDKTEELESMFESSIKRAMNSAIEGFKKDIECIIRDVKERFEDISDRIDVGSIPALGITKLITEGIILVLLDFIIPAGVLGKVGRVLEKGPIDAILGGGLIKLSNRWPSLKKFWDSIMKPIREIIQLVVGKVVAKPFVQKHIEDANNRAKEMFRDELRGFSRKIFENFKQETSERFEKGEKTVLESLESLKTQKREKSEEFGKYIDGLRAIKKEINELPINQSL